MSVLKKQNSVPTLAKPGLSLAVYLLQRFLQPMQTSYLCRFWSRVLPQEPRSGVVVNVKNDGHLRMLSVSFYRRPDQLIDRLFEFGPDPDSAS
jgi:hypothetical protein